MNQMLLTNDEISDIYEQPSKTPREFARSIEAAVLAKLREQEPVALPFAILDEEIKDLHRFHECVSDGEGYDVPKERMKRLSEIGLLRRVTANIYEHTTFGLSVINGDFTHPAPIPEGRKTCSRDTDRLNFLDHNLKFKMGWQVGQAPAGNVSVTSVIMGGKNIREAIDTLMLAAARSE